MQCLSNKMAKVDATAAKRGSARLQKRSARKSGRRCSVKKLFAKIDKDASGTVSLKEVEQAFKKAVGSSKSGRLSYKQMKSACNKYAGNAPWTINNECYQHSNPPKLENGPNKGQPCPSGTVCKPYPAAPNGPWYCW